MISRLLVDDMLSSASGYPGLFVFCALSGLLIPLPEDVALLYAGIQVKRGNFGLAAALLVTCSGALVRDLLVYSLGRGVGDWLIDHPRLRPWIGGARVRRARKLVSERGETAVMMGRFSIGMRALVFFMAGSAGVSLRSFVFTDVIGICITVPIIVGLGYFLGEPVFDMLSVVLQSTRLMVGLSAIALLAFVVWKAD